ncbi:hypothetical protein [Cochleicola gelatinilyticus]|uniref:Lipoprotein n=1 Tax=Cochleicola gelatinilyticus TaxID=1763537 RepID=A0A167HJF8_9FLAO|nr:hypothetical protein [Cochleicola gelatinilyticus]OAB78675.1 hypothetical protein ULVI_08825 [Cochleicola gelatinilyticus]
MKTLFFMAAFTASLVSCTAQETKQDRDASQNSQVEASEPQGSWTVNKEFDEQGNLVKYDSIYSYSYGSVNGKPMPSKSMDSIMNLFQDNFNQGFPSISEDPYMSSFFNGPKNLGGGFDMNARLKHMDSVQKLFIDRFFNNQMPHSKPVEDPKLEHQRI